MKRLFIILVLFIFWTDLSFSQSFTIFPTEADTGKTVNIIVKGNFDNDNYSIGFDYRGSKVDIVVNSVQKEGSTSLKANITIGSNVFTREYDVLIIQDRDTIDILWDIFHVNGLPRPIIKSITPNYGRQGDTVDIVIIGENTHFYQADYNYFIVDNYHLYDSTLIFDKKIINDTLITLKYAIPWDGHLGWHNVYLRNKIDDWVWVENGFNIYRPWLKTIIPSKVYRGDTIDFTLIGANTHFLKSTQIQISIYQWGDTSISKTNSINVINDTLINANIIIPINIKCGNYRFDLWNDIDKKVIYGTNFEIIPPGIDSIIPNNLKGGDTSVIKIYTNHTHFKQSQFNSFRIFNDIYNLRIDSNYSVINDTILELKVMIPHYIYSDNYNFSIDNTIDGFLYKENCIMIDGINRPQLIQVISEKLINIGDTIEIQIKGSNTHFLNNNGINVMFISYNDTISQKDFLFFSVLNDSIINSKIIIPNNEFAFCYDLQILDSLDGKLVYNCALNINGQIIIGIPTQKINNFEFYVCPNPIISDLTLVLNAEQASSIMIDLISLSGIKVRSYSNQSINVGKNLLSFDLSLIDSGIYLLSVSDLKQNKKGFKLIVKK
jgi:hypothetical protein